MLDRQVQSMRILRIKLLMACALGLLFVGTAAYSAFMSHQPGWGVALSLAGGVLVAWTIRLITFKV